MLRKAVFSIAVVQVLLFLLVANTAIGAKGFDIFGVIPFIFFAAVTYVVNLGCLLFVAIDAWNAGRVSKELAISCGVALIPLAYWILNDLTLR